MVTGRIPPYVRIGGERRGSGGGESSQAPTMNSGAAVKWKAID